MLWKHLRTPSYAPDSSVTESLQLDTTLKTVYKEIQEIWKKEI
jgi:hypothetical protein